MSKNNTYNNENHLKQSDNNLISDNLIQDEEQFLKEYKSDKKGLWNKSLKEIGPFVHAKGPIFVVKLTCNENFTQ